MKKSSKRTPVRHGLFDLPLFAWAARPNVAIVTTAGRWVHRQYRVRPEIADTVATLAGLGGERTQ
jgi:hypothetical protein